MRRLAQEHDREQQLDDSFPERSNRDDQEQGDLGTDFRATGMAHPDIGGVHMLTDQSLGRSDIDQLHDDNKDMNFDGTAVRVSPGKERFEAKDFSGPHITPEKDVGAVSLNDTLWKQQERQQQSASNQVRLTLIVSIK
jgi:hypothetical protein